MNSTELEPELSEEESEIVKTVRRFADEEMRPAGQALDKMNDPSDAIAPDSIFWDVHKKYLALVLDIQLTPRLQSIMYEELGRGDAGLAISFAVSGLPGFLAGMSPDPEIKERFGHPGVIGCLAMTEPNHGSDNVSYMVDPDNKPVPAKPNCVARMDGDEFVITGQKSAWVTNGTIGNVCALSCLVDTGKGIDGFANFIVPLDGPEVTRGKPLDKIGKRAQNQGEIYFEGLRVPKSYMVVPPEVTRLGGGKLALALANSTMGAVYVGAAQSAYELAVGYAKERVQGGSPIISHQSVKSRLFEMFRKVEAARALSRRVLGAGSKARLRHAIATKVTSTQTALDVASAALQIFGGAGLSREYPIEKIFRDARAGLIEDGCNEMLGILAAEEL